MGLCRNEMISPMALLHRMRCRGLMASPSTRLRPVTATLCAAALALLTACGGGGGDDAKKGGDGAGKSTTSPVVTPTATAPVTRGKGSALPDDLNGDGRPELRIPLASGQELGSLRRIAYVYGAAKGVDPAVRTVLGRADLGLPTGAGWQERDAGEMHSATTADLDGDGFADVIATATKQRDPAAPSAYTSPPRPSPTSPGAAPKGRAGEPPPLPCGWPTPTTAWRSHGP